MKQETRLKMIIVVLVVVAVVLIGEVIVKADASCQLIAEEMGEQFEIRFPRNGTSRVDKIGFCQYEVTCTREAGWLLYTYTFDVDWQGVRVRK